MRRSTTATVGDRLEYVVVRTLEATLALLPPGAGRRVARRIGDLVRVMDRSARKQRMARDILDAFPEYTGRQVSELVKESYRFLAVSLADGLGFLARAGTGHNAPRIDARGLEMLEGLGKDVGTIFVTGHFGHWEVLGGASGLIGRPVASLARPLSNPLLERRVRKLRESTGQKILGKRGSMQRAIRALKRGEDLAFLIDQDARRHGIFVDFLGKPASTVTSVARIAIYTGAPIVFVYARRVGSPDRYEVVLKDVIRPSKEADEQDEIFRITQRFTSDLEQVVRQWPGEWFWLHDRWKTYPGKHKEQREPGGTQGPIKERESRIGNQSAQR